MSSPNTPPLAAQPAVKAKLDLLSAWIEAQMAYAGQPGLSIAIVYDQEIIWAQGFGYANREKQRPATPATLYRIASITKLFTSTAIMQLRDAGQIQLDDPVGKHLPWFTIQEQYPDAPPITIRHLLTHTSGLPREAGFPYWTDSNFPTLEEIKAALPQLETILPTETRLKYSNLALTLAGEIVAAVSGQAYPDYIKTHILEPLGMEQTYVVAPDPDHPDLATGYGRRYPSGERQFSPFTDCQGITPAANMTTSVEDLARFAMLQFRDGPAGGPQILRGSTLREMQRVHWLNPDWQSGWGLGFQIFRQKEQTIIAHGGAVQGYRTGIHLIPAEKLGAIVFTNADDGNPGQYLEKVFQWVAPAIKKATAQEDEAKADPAWQAYAGRYRSAWGDLQVLIVENDLLAIDPSQANPMETPVKLVPVAEHTFRIETKNAFGSPGELAIFELDEDGQVVRVQFGANYMEPVANW